MKCPHCGNRNPDCVETNGLDHCDPVFSYLCTARVAPGESDNPEHEVIGPDGRVMCGMQWNPYE